MDSKSGSTGSVFSLKSQIPTVTSPTAEIPPICCFFFSRNAAVSIQGYPHRNAIKTMTLDMFVRDMYKLRSDIPCVAALHDFHHFQALLALELLQAAPLALSHFRKTTITYKKICSGKEIICKVKWLMNLCG